MADYHINIFYSEEDKGYIADIPATLRLARLLAAPRKRRLRRSKKQSGPAPPARAAHKPIPPPRHPAGHLSSGEVILFALPTVPQSARRKVRKLQSGD